MIFLFKFAHCTCFYELPDRLLMNNYTVVCELNEFPKCFFILFLTSSLESELHNISFHFQQAYHLTETFNLLLNLSWCMIAINVIQLWCFEDKFNNIMKIYIKYIRTHRIIYNVQRTISVCFTIAIHNKLSLKDNISKRRR